MQKEPGTARSKTVKVKICGMMDVAAAQVAARAGADMLGFIQYPRSPRYIAPDQARRIIDDLRGQLDRAPDMVGVFVNASVENVSQVTRQAGFDIIQLHGAESPAVAHALRRAGWRVFKAFAIADAQSVAQFDAYKVDGYLCDTLSPDQWGGTGRVFDHTLLADAASHRRIILAGGLTPENVAQAIRQVRPWAVDVSSGVEVSRGIKDHEKIVRFTQAVASVEDISAPE